MGGVSSNTRQQDDCQTNRGGSMDTTRPTKPSELDGLAEKLRSEIRKDLDERLGRRPAKADVPIPEHHEPANGPEARPFGATQTCPACGGSGDGVSGAACGCCGGRGWIGSD
jgi:hypothetical protein